MAISAISGNENGGCCCNPGQEKLRKVSGCGSCTFITQNGWQTTLSGISSVPGGVYDGKDFSAFNTTWDLDNFDLQAIQVANPSNPSDVTNLCGWYSTSTISSPVSAVAVLFHETASGSVIITPSVDSWVFGFIAASRYMVGTQYIMFWTSPDSTYDCFGSNTFTAVSNSNVNMPSSITLSPR